MKPIVKQKVAIYSPIGFLDGENAMEIITPAEINHLKKIKPEGAFVSLKRVVSFNKRGVALIVEFLVQVREFCGTVIGFCDYDDKKYNMMINMFANNINFSMFDTSEIAMLFVGSDVNNAKEKKIIVYEDSSGQKNQLAMELLERGYDPVVAKDKEDFLSQRKNMDFIVEHSFLGKFLKTPSIFIKENVVIYMLKGYVDSSMSKQFDMIYHNNSLRVGFKLFLFDCSDVSSLNVHGVNYISKISTAGAEYGISIIITGLSKSNISSQLINDLEDSGVMIYPNINQFFEDEEMMKEAQDNSSVAKRKKGVTKKLIEHLPLILKTSVKTIEVLSGYNAEKNSLKIQKLDLKKDSNLLSVAIGIYGAFEGILILIMEKSIAKKACDILLEEDSDDNDILEALGEFIHIVGGKITQQLHKDSIKIDITMPRTFTSVDDVMASQIDSKGAQVDMSIDGKDLTLFLTR